MKKSIRRNLIAKRPGPIQLAGGRMLDVCGAALLLGVTERWIRRRISRGLLPYRRFSGRIFFLRTELEEFVASLPGTTLDEAKANLRIRSGDGGRE